MPEQSFSSRVLEWFERHGRKDLPWQHDINPYRVWVSEIMLQQTQVKTVIPYFARFMDAFPDVNALAAAAEDQVLHLWTGLGYYARARNLHKTAQLISSQRNGQFPDSVEDLSALPGIGRSTAGAIVSIAMGKPAPLLDGNVKRVLARFCAIEGWPGRTKVLKSLWEVAEKYTPSHSAPDYSQAMMDLGATVCLPKAPLCDVCPLQSSCAAHQQGRELDYPGKKPRKAMPVKTTTMVMICTPDTEVYLAKRPASGIWGGLWSFPELESPADVANYCRDTLHAEIREIEEWTLYRHTFSHYHLDIIPVRIQLQRTPEKIMEGTEALWYNNANPEAIGLAAPVAKLLQLLHD